MCLTRAADQEQQVDKVLLLVAHHKTERAGLVCDPQRVVFICGSKDTSAHSQRSHKRHAKQRSRD